MAIAVKRYTSLMAGAPVMTGVAGTLVSLLDACLKDGFNPKTPTGLVQTGGTATATCTAHGYEPGDVIAISGANEAVWNNEFRVLTTTTDSLTFAIASNATSPATGTFAAKIAPLGWTKPFSGTNKAAYLPAAPYAQCYLRVLDDSTTPTSASGRWAKLRGYESMTDIDTGTGPFPTVAQVANGLSFNKSGTSDSTARAWWLIGDAGIFYAGVFWLAATPTVAATTMFGDTGSLRAGDAFCAALIGTEMDTLPGSACTNNTFCAMGAYTATQAGKYYARSYTQTGSAVAIGMVGDNGLSVTIGQSGVAYPHPPNDGLLISAVSTAENNIIRCRQLPGLYQPLHNCPLAYRDTRTDFAELPGRTLMALDTGTVGTRAQLLFDVTGPWR